MSPHEFEMVWYSPELDLISTGLISSGCVFYDEYGPFHSRWSICTLRCVHFYLVGAL